MSWFRKTFLYWYMNYLYILLIVFLLLVGVVLIDSLCSGLFLTISDIVPLTVTMLMSYDFPGMKTFPLNWYIGSSSFIVLYVVPFSVISYLVTTVLTGAVHFIWRLLWVKLLSSRIIRPGADGTVKDKSIYVHVLKSIFSYVSFHYLKQQKSSNKNYNCTVPLFWWAYTCT